MSKASKASIWSLISHAMCHLLIRLALEIRSDDRSRACSLPRKATFQEQGKRLKQRVCLPNRGAHTETRTLQLIAISVIESFTVPMTQPDSKVPCSQFRIHRCFDLNA